MCPMQYLQFELLNEDVSCALFDGGCIINCQSHRQPLAAYLVFRVKTQNVKWTGHWAKHIEHLKHIQIHMWIPTR